LDGQLTEVVWLDGNRHGLSDEELERFIERFPVQRRGVSPGAIFGDGCGSSNGR